MVITSEKEKQYNELRTRINKMLEDMFDVSPDLLKKFLNGNNDIDIDEYTQIKVGFCLD